MRCPVRNSLPDHIPLLSSVLICLPAAVAMALPPLESEQQAILSTALDDRDHQDAAFAMLAEELLARPVGTARSTSLRLGPDEWSGWVDSPDAQRGRGVLLEGRIEQRTMLPRPWEGFCELFVRLPDDVVVAVFTPVGDAAPVGARARLEGRFYKRLSAVARDGVPRRYPAVVARVLPGGGGNWSVIMIPIALLGLGVCWVLVRRTARAARSIPRGGPRAVAAAKSSTIPPELPDDPARALDVLHSRHDHPDQGGAS